MAIVEEVPATPKLVSWFLGDDLSDVFNLGE